MFQCFIDGRETIKPDACLQCYLWCSIFMGIPDKYLFYEQKLSI